MASLGAPWPGVAAVSGGGDSAALMQLLCEWAKGQKAVPPVVLTVDHGLHPESHEIAEDVRKLARKLGATAHVLVWKGTKPRADIEAEARAARYRLMGAWCRDNRIGAVYLGHTRDDQAETFLLRLARGSGLDGLSAMKPVSDFPIPEFAGIKLIRPLLEVDRKDLRQFLSSRGLPWAEDPMNEDPQFARSRLRAAWPQLEALGLSPARVADAACHLGRAREALEALTAEFLQRGVRYQLGIALFDPIRLKLLPREIGMRALAAVLCRISGEEYRPRFESLERLYNAVVGDTLGSGATLHGCMVAPAPVRDQVFGAATLTILREPERRRAEPQAPSRRKS